MSNSIKFGIIAAITFVVMILINIFVVLSSALVSGLFLMVVLDIVSEQTAGAVPALGYWSSVAVSFALTFIGVASARLAGLNPSSTPKI